MVEGVLLSWIVVANNYCSKKSGVIANLDFRLGCIALLSHDTVFESLIAVKPQHYKKQLLVAYASNIEPARWDLRRWHQAFAIQQHCNGVPSREEDNNDNLSVAADFSTAGVSVVVKETLHSGQTNEMCWYDQVLSANMKDEGILTKRGSLDQLATDLKRGQLPHSMLSKPTENRGTCKEFVKE